ncbi:MAG: hypothetical protein JNK64_26235 [Myxococcales bacterium]|nr:hypothetical protein [Myxococcales bacterium]
MRRVAMVGLGGVAALIAACSEPVDEELPCGAREIVRDHRSPLCLSAHELAKRATAAIIPTQAEVDAAAAVIRAGFAPLRAQLDVVPTAASWNQERGQVTWYIHDPALAAAWSAGLGPSGDATVDAVVAAMDVWDFTLTSVTGVAVAGFQSRGAVSAANVAAALAAVPSITVERFSERGAGSSSDVIDLGVDAAGTRTLEFWIGWGDCQAGCIQSHHWRTTIAPDGSAALVAEWGDPLTPR